MAVFAQEKSVAYNYFFDKASEVGREMATGGACRGEISGFARTNMVPDTIFRLRWSQLQILKPKYGVRYHGEKAGASNKPGSVIDNHSSGIAVAGYL